MDPVVKEEQEHATQLLLQHLRVEATNMYDDLPKQLRDYIKDSPFGISTRMLRQLHSALKDGVSIENLIWSIKRAEEGVRKTLEGEITHDMHQARVRETRRLQQRHDRLYGGR